MKNKSVDTTSNDRIAYIEGIRGIASVLVIFCHIACVFFPEYAFFKEPNSSFSRLWVSSPLNVLTNGNAAVQCFFVLSGYLIARKIYSYVAKAPERELDSSPVKVYRKLLRIVIPGVLLSAVLMKLGAMYHLKAAAQYPRLSFVNDYCNFEPSIKRIAVDCFLFENYFNGPFWTIKFELFGAILSTVLAYFTAKNRTKSKLFLLFAAIIFTFISPNLVSFVVGIFAFDYLSSEKDKKTAPEGVKKKAAAKRITEVFVFIAGVYLACINNTVSGVYLPISYIPIIKSSPEIVRAVGISVCLVCIERTGALKRILSVRPLVYLGKISAYVYAFHWLIILSAGCGIFLATAEITSYNTAAFIAAASVFLITIPTAALFTKLMKKFVDLESRFTAFFKSKLIKNK